MTFDQEWIKAVQDQIDVTYEEAERYLHKAKGDVDKAVHLIRRKRASSINRLIDETVLFFQDLLLYDLIVEGKGKRYLDLPILVLIVFFIVLPMDTKIWILLMSIGLILISESQVQIHKREDEQQEKYVRKEDNREAEQEVRPQEATTQAEQESDEATVTRASDQDDDDDYYEITIEK